jgi:hypothetical protein
MPLAVSISFFQRANSAGLEGRELLGRVAHDLEAQVEQPAA